MSQYYQTFFFINQNLFIFAARQGQIVKADQFITKAHPYITTKTKKMYKNDVLQDLPQANKIQKNGQNIYANTDHILTLSENA